ncbi:cation channel sperm-associated protein subunit gamma 2-like [Pocillopora damicornis]|uniref:cation channel sperm-associated protein subunit gamma 2-like n=1 Tax=Pocillopora damicornis TaxID=46731 RepID=UPI000F55088E|nr:cation channel sperm-associated protein subunit gamma 2-like [Pocillopora damicornis]
MYNYQTTSSMASLIWASKLKTLGDIPVFDSKTNGISWLCGTQSPCADIGPTFPGNAEYYFKLEFSNRIVDADSSNCDYTIRFLIRVHGLPPGSLNPSSLIVLSCIAILAVLILTFFLLKRQDSKVWKHIKSGLSVVRHVPGLCRAGICGKVISMRRNKIDHLEDQDQVQLQVINRDSEYTIEAPIEVSGNRPQQLHTTNV